MAAVAWIYRNVRKRCCRIYIENGTGVSPKQSKLKKEYIDKCGFLPPCSLAASCNSELTTLLLPKVINIYHGGSNNSSDCYPGSLF